MVVREGLDYFPGCTCMLNMCTPEHVYRAYIRQCITVSYTLKMAFGCTGSRCIPRKRSDQPTTMFAGTSTLSSFNTERRRPTLVAFPKTRIQKTSFKYWHPRVTCRFTFLFISNLFSTLHNPLNRHLADPKVDDSSSQFSLPFYTLFWSWCYAFVQ